MKEFLVYTGLRLLLLVAAFAVVYGIWLLVADDSASVLGSLIVAALISGVGSYTILRGPRERFAGVVQQRAERASAAFEQLRHDNSED